MRAKDLRKLSREELEKRLKDINLEIMKFRARSKGWAVRVPKSRTGGINWGVFKQLKKEKARILTVLNEFSQS